jgi:hypothetical protein
VFYLPLAFIGFNWIQFVVVNQFQTLYQFWIHTRTIGKLPWIIELIWNTPSHHRVHHGVNPKYIDKNHAGTFIIWDRMFGTFQKEEEEVVYGITKPLKTWNPVWANLDYFRDLFGTLSKCKNLKDALKVLFKGPGWRPDYLGGPQLPHEVTPQKFEKFETRISPGMNTYVLIQFIFVLLGASAFLFLAGKMEIGWRIAFGSMIAFSIAGLGELLEGRKRGMTFEFCRLAITAGLVAAFFKGTIFQWHIAMGLCAFVFLSGLWLTRVESGKAETNPN